MGAVKWDKITARDVTDTERRAMCVIAARHFGLAYELWAKDPIEDPYREEEEAKPAPKGAKTKAKQDPPTQAQSPAKPEVDPLDARRAECSALLLDIYQNQKDASVVDKFRKHMKLRFNGTIKVEEKFLKVEHLTTEEMVAECETWIANYKPPVKQK